MLFLDKKLKRKKNFISSLGFLKKVKKSGSNESLVITFTVN